MLSAEDIIKQLALKPHPEGGYFRETFRDPRMIEGRAASTAIYYLLRAHEVSRWHRVNATEIWHWYAGSPLTLALSADGKTKQEQVLGPALHQHQQPQLIVPANVWQSAQSLGGYTLVGCTVAPGFEFSGFEMALEGFAP